MIATNHVVSIDYLVKDTEGNVIDSSDGQDPLTFLCGAKNIIPGLESGLMGKKAGDDFEITAEPKEAYGEYNAEMVQTVPRSAFEGVEDIELGMGFSAQTDNGPMSLIVTGIDEETDEITIDPNHPLAGRTLIFTGKIIEVRDGTAEEMEHGHVHGAGGHHH